MDIFDVYTTIWQSYTRIKIRKANRVRNESSKSKSWVKIQRHAVPITTIDRNWLYRLTVKIVEKNSVRCILSLLLNSAKRRRATRQQQKQRRLDKKRCCVVNKVQMSNKNKNKMRKEKEKGIKNKEKNVCLFVTQRFSVVLHGPLI